MFYNENIKNIKMSQKIYKYQLETEDVQTIEMPHGAEILTIETQNRKPCIWALVDTNAIITTRTFEIFGTGHTVPDNVNRKYVGTYQFQGGELVFHCFELIEI